MGVPIANKEDVLKTFFWIRRFVSFAVLYIRHFVHATIDKKGKFIFSIEKV